ncbi:VOC family protein [Catenovulum adriaticum]|uniref:VOC family protein n=1 Tax=Catenovulum adriaticum TaxID=2984846 RepID=A0ABY7AMU6_9ALTE|nr:VOC family protein [Catenovulum sp. TS8]WAJ70878.1 VOC family protein [Catenovulum sp. TS8]
MLKMAGLDHIVLRTTKLTQMLDFYCGHLGCTLERKTDDSLGLTQLRAGNTLIDIVTFDSKLGKLADNPPDLNSPNLDHFCLQVETSSMDEICQYLTQHYIPHTEPENRYGAQGFGLSVYLTDPQGNTVELKPKVDEG